MHSTITGIERDNIINGTIDDTPNNAVDNTVNAIANTLNGTRHAPCSVGETDDDNLHEACGVFGIWAPELDVSRMAFFGLQALQHRGQESAGIAVTNERRLTCKKGLGLAREVFDDKTIESLQGIAAIGHVRYSTSGKDPEISLQMTHPIVGLEGAQKFALAHNGTLTNTADLIAALEDSTPPSTSSTISSTTSSAVSDATNSTGPNNLTNPNNPTSLRNANTAVCPNKHVSDTQLATDLLAQYFTSSSDMQASIERLMHLIQGAYSMVVLTNDALYTMRDFSGIRPLCLGELPGNAGWVIASETCAFDLVGATYMRDIEPGEIVRIDANGLHSTQVSNTIEHVPARPAHCLFEYVYFARPDSVIDGANVYRAREAMGRRLFHEAPVEADIVIGVPDSGIPAAIGYARESGVIYSEGLIKNRYVDRTFIQPTQELREQGIRIKLNPLHYAVRNRRIIVVDDSIVRGSTSKQLVQMLRDAGAAEVHLRITSPAIVWPCFLGINTDTQGQLIAATKTVEETCAYIGADSLAYLSLEGLKSCIYAQHPEYCSACFDGDYPMPCPNPLHDDAFLPGYHPTWNNN